MSLELAPWAQRLRAIAPELLVGGAADVATAIEQGPLRAPAVFLVSPDDSAEPNRLDAGGLRQRVTARLNALICVRNVADSRGDAASQATKPIEDLLDNAFLNWTPDSALLDPAEYVRGGLASFQAKGNYLWWTCVYQTRFYKTRT